MQNDKTENVVRLNVYTYIFLHLFPLKIDYPCKQCDMSQRFTHSRKKQVIKENGSYEGLTLPKL